MSAKLRRVIPSSYPAVWPAVISNPLVDVAYTNEPVGIRVWFWPGECPAATYLKVKNPSGTAVDFQWEPAKHTLNDGADMGAWPDGSLRHGTLWVVVPSLAANASQRWTVELYSAAQSYSPTQNVTFSVTDASNEVFQTSGVTLNFKDTSCWMPQSMIDRSTSQELLATSTGLTMRQKAGAVAGEVLSSTTTEVTGVSHQRIGSSNTGYGVAYQEMEGTWTWTDQATNTRLRTRLWANGRVTIEAYTYATSAIGSDAKSLILNISANNTGIVTPTGDNDKGRKLWEYASSNFVCGFRYLTTDYEAKTTETHSTNWSTSIASNRMFGGWIGTTSLPSGAYWFQSCFLSLYATGDVENAWQRGMNPIMTTAARWSKGTVQSYLVGFTQRYIEAWLPFSTDSDKKGIEGALRIVLGDMTGSPYSAATALTKFEEYCTGAGITSSSASSWHSVWNAGQGMNFIAKNGESLPYIRRRAAISGDTTTAATCATIMTALADFVVLAEATSGGSGNMKLDGTGLDNYNAEASAMGLLAQALAEFGANTTWQACYERIATRYISGNFAGGTRRTYRLQSPGSLPNDAVKAPQSTYDSYQNYEFARAMVIWPLSSSYVVPNMRQYLYEVTNAAFMPEDRKYQGQVTRRGLTNTILHWVLTLAYYGNESDWNAIGLILKLCDGQIYPKNGQKHPQHGYSGTDVTMLNVMADIRGCAETLRLRLARELV